MEKVGVPSRKIQKQVAILMQQLGYKAPTTSVYEIGDVGEVEYLAELSLYHCRLSVLYRVIDHGLVKVKE